MARCPFAIWRGPIPNMKPDGMTHPVRGVILHVEEGTEQGTDSWFHNPQAQASAHFGIAADGTIHQWVDTDDRAWAEMAGNAYWWSVETEGRHTDPMTPPQVAALARLYGWLMTLPDGVPAHLAETPDDRGFGWHGMGGQLWGGHLDCPGDQRRAQRAEVLAFIHPPQPTEDDMPTAIDPQTGGLWICPPDGGVRAEAGARYLGSLPAHPDWNAGEGKPNGRAIAIGAVGDGYTIFTQDPAGGVHPYHFPGDGSLR